jgi:hypothetical protein
MIAAGFFATRIQPKYGRTDADLRGDIIKHGLRRNLVGQQRPARIAHQAELDRKTELIVFSPAHLDFQQIGWTKRIVANQTVFIYRNVEQRRSLVFLEKRSPGHFSTPRQNGNGQASPHFLFDLSARF